MGAQHLEQSVDLVVTSPPYNLGIKYSNYDDQRTSEEYLAWSCDWASAVKRVLKDDGALFLMPCGFTLSKTASSMLWSKKPIINVLWH